MAPRGGGHGEARGDQRIAEDDPPRVMGQISRTRGRRVLDAERAIGAPDALTEDDVLEFLLKELEAFVDR